MILFLFFRRCFVYFDLGICRLFCCISLPTIASHVLLCCVVFLFGCCFGYVWTWIIFTIYPVENTNNYTMLHAFTTSKQPFMKHYATSIKRQRHTHTHTHLAIGENINVVQHTHRETVHTTCFAVFGHRSPCTDQNATKWTKCARCSR